MLKKQRWTDLGQSSVQQATNFWWEFHVSLSLLAYLHARIICVQDISAPYPERYLNMHCRSIKKFQVILLKFPIPDTAHSQHIILSLWTSTKKSCFLTAIRWKGNIRKRKGNIGWMNVWNYHMATAPKGLEQKHVTFFLHFLSVPFLIIWKKWSVCIFFDCSSARARINHSTTRTDWPASSNSLDFFVILKCCVALL